MILDSFLNHKTKTVGLAGIILATSSIISRFLGVIRDLLLAQKFGAGSELDIYFAAFKIPDFVYNVLILGGVLVAFLPLFSEYFTKDEKEAWKFSSNCLNIFLFLLVSLSLILFFFTPFLMKLIAPGFNADQMQKTVTLTRIMFLSPIFFGLSSIFSGILQYFNRFLVYSLCPILYNLGIIFGIIFLTPKFGILGVGFGVILGAFLHFAIQIPSVIRCGFNYKFVLDFKDTKIKRVFSLMIPRSFGVSVQQINLIVINAIASTLSAGSISIFTFANNVQYFPIGIVGASLATAVFPTLSKSWAEKKKEEFIKSFSSVFRQIMYFIFPISFLIFILRSQIIEILLQRGEFSGLAASLTSASLALFCFGIFASSLLPLFFRAFFSLKDTKTPTIIAIVSMGVSIALSFFLTQSLVVLPKTGMMGGLEMFLRQVFSLKTEDISVLGLPLAVSIGAIFQFTLLFIFLKKRIGDFDLERIKTSFLKILIAVTLMGASIYLALPFLETILNSNSFKALWQIIIVSILGALVYFITTLLLGLSEAKTIISFFKKEAEN